MKSIVNKYFQSVISPDEFETFYTFIKQERNTESILKLMKKEWDHQLDNDSVGNVLPNPLLFQTIKSAILQDENSIATRKLKLYMVAVRIAAVLLIGMLVTGILVFMQKDLAIGNISTQTVSIPFGAQTQLRLPDGTFVWLNSGSTLTYSDNFSKKRQVELKGEAFFDVVKGKSPFMVNTPWGTVEVLGTAFNVHVYENDEFSVTLERGIVNVSDNGEKQKIMMNPGEQVRLVQNKLVKSTVNTVLFTSWKDGKLIFAREPFPAMIQRLERWFNVEIEHVGYDFEGLWFSGTIEGETLTEVMDMICKAAPVRYSYDTKARKVKIETKRKMK